MTKTSLIPLIAFAGMALPTSTIQARGENEITRLAHNVQRLASEIRNEFQTHYKRSSAYRHLRTDIDAVIVKANHIDELSHDPRTSYRHIMTDLEDLDKLAHHLHEVVDDVERGRYQGWVEGGLEHVHNKMLSLNAAIHGMQNAIIAYSTPVYESPSSGYDNCPFSRGSSYGRDYDSGFRSQVRESGYGSRSDFYYDH